MGGEGGGDAWDHGLVYSNGRATRSSTFAAASWGTAPHRPGAAPRRPVFLNGRSGVRRRRTPPLAAADRGLWGASIPRQGPRSGGGLVGDRVRKDDRVPGCEESEGRAPGGRRGGRPRSHPIRPSQQLRGVPHGDGSREICRSAPTTDHDAGEEAAAAEAGHAGAEGEELANESAGGHVAVRPAQRRRRRLAAAAAPPCPSSPPRRQRWACSSGGSARR